MTSGFHSLPVRRKQLQLTVCGLIPSLTDSQTIIAAVHVDTSPVLHFYSVVPEPDSRHGASTTSTRRMAGDRKHRCRV